MFSFSVASKLPVLLWQAVLRQENVLRLAAEVLYNFYMSRENMFYAVDVRS